MTIDAGLLAELLYRAVGAQLDTWPFGDLVDAAIVRRLRAEHAETGDPVGTSARVPA